MPPSGAREWQAGPRGIEPGGFPKPTLTPACENPYPQSGVQGFTLHHLGVIKGSEGSNYPGPVPFGFQDDSFDRTV